MEIAKVEMTEIEKVATNEHGLEIKTLADLQLALVGGGCGDISLG